MENYDEINSLRNDLSNLRKLVERMAVVLNEGFVKSLYEEVVSVQKGDYLSEEEFFKKHNLKTP